jgi:hypothetical protein
MSKFRERLMSALNDAVGHYNGGLGDNEAVVKAASEHDFNPNQTQRLVETYNTAKSLYFFKSADDRRSEFPIADPANVVSSLFSAEAVKSKPVEKVANTGLYDYTMYNDRELDFHEKVAVDQYGTPPWDQDEPDSFTGEMKFGSLVERADKQIRSAKQAAARCGDTAGMCDTKYGLSLEKIADFIRKDYHMPEKMAYTEHGLWETFGKEIAEPVIDDLMPFLPQAAQEKRADENTYGEVTDFDTRHPEIVAMFKDAVDARFGAAQMRALEADFNKRSEEWEGQFKEAAGLESPPDPLDDFMPDGLCKRAQPTTYMGGDLGSIGGGSSPKGDSKTLLGESTKALAQGITAPAKEIPGLVAKTYTGPAQREAKTVRERVHNLQRQLILEDLIVNDPVLSGEDPQKVVSAYGALLTWAPEVSLNKEVSRSVLRSATQAVATTPFDAKSWVDLENEIRKQLEVPSKLKGPKKQEDDEYKAASAVVKGRM